MNDDTPARLRPSAPVRRPSPHLGRRRFLSLLATAGGLSLVAPGLAGCGSDSSGGGGGGGASSLGRAVSSVRRASLTSGGLQSGSRIIADFTGDMFARIADATGAGGNVIVSPYSMALALGMTRNGAVGSTAAQMDHALGSTSAAQLNAGLNAVTQTLATRAGTKQNASGKDATVALEVACTLFGQTGVTWKQPFLDALAASYGAGVELVDYVTATEAARSMINTWTSDHTAHLIRELVPAGALDPQTRLVLVNALHLKAPWHKAFDKAQTMDGAFHRADGSNVTAPMMRSSDLVVPGRSGDGWTAARLPYAGLELAMTVFLPGDGREKTLVTQMGADLAAMLSGFDSNATVVMPRFSSRWGTTSVKKELQARGMTTAFTSAADFSGMTDQEKVTVSDVLHQATITVDEEGTEAAAATAAVMEASAAQAPPMQVVLDRPFVYVIHDIASGTPLFVGRVSDPTAS